MMKRSRSQNGNICWRCPLFHSQVMAIWRVGGILVRGHGHQYVPSLPGWESSWWYCLPPLYRGMSRTVIGMINFAEAQPNTINMYSLVWPGKCHLCATTDGFDNSCSETLVCFVDNSMDKLPQWSAISDTILANRKLSHCVQYCKVNRCFQST